MRYRFLGMLRTTGILKTALFFLTALSAISTCAAAENNSKINANRIDAATRDSIAKSYGNLPLSFEANNGQMDDAVKFLSKGNGYTLFLTSIEAVLSLRRGSLKDKEHIVNPNPEADESKPVSKDVIRLKLIGANSNSKITGLDELQGKSNYFIGNDPAKWRTDVTNYAKVKIEDVYRGIDLIYYGNQRQLEYDWIVKPGADPKSIRFAVEGNVDLKVDLHGNLILSEKSELRLNKPFIYQEIAGSHEEIAGRYILHGTREVGFQLDRYDISQPLVIDPILSYSTYLGGSHQDIGNGIAVDSSGNAYVVGTTGSTNFPTKNPIQASSGGSNDTFVTKLSASGNELVYSTFLGGSGGEEGIGIAVDSSGNAYVAGSTSSTNFPTLNPIQASYAGGGDVYVAKLNASGNALVYSTFLGGSSWDDGHGIAVDSSGNAYVTGLTYSTNFPMLNPLQASNGGLDDVFVTKLNASGSALVYSTYLGGSHQDAGIGGIAVDSSGNAYVTGMTISTNFPTANPFQASRGGGTYDAFVTKLNASGSELIYSTYLGGGYDDIGQGIAVDSSGNAYVTGNTGSSDFPMANPLESCTSNRAFVTKLNTSGSELVYSTCLGTYVGYGIAVDSSGNAYVTGLKSSSGASVAFFTKLNASGNELVYSTYLGGSGDEYAYGIAVDSSGNAYVTGFTTSTDFPTADPFQASYGGSYDAFVTKITPVILIPSCDFDFDGDCNADITVWRPDTGVWHILGNTATQWGLSTDIPVAGDYDGDYKMDIAVWRPDSGVWYILPSNSPATYTATQWGMQDDKPVAGDYDGDGKNDSAVWRPSDGTWYILPSNSSGTYTATSWGISSDIPVPSDYDGDGKDDIAVYRPDNGTWYALSSETPETYTSTNWGLSDDIPVPGDYDLDAKTDIAVWRPSDGTWYILPSNSPGTYRTVSWGVTGDMPVPGDYDGDDMTDIAVWRPFYGIWYIGSSRSPGIYRATSWGIPTDVPISAITGILRSLP
jgi:hypothetical protein